MGAQYRTLEDLNKHTHTHTQKQIIIIRIDLICDEWLSVRVYWKQKDYELENYELIMWQR